MYKCRQNHSTDILFRQFVQGNSYEDHITQILREYIKIFS